MDCHTTKVLHAQRFNLWKGIWTDLTILHGVWEGLAAVTTHVYDILLHLIVSKACRTAGTDPIATGKGMPIQPAVTRAVKHTTRYPHAREGIQLDSDFRVRLVVFSTSFLLLPSRVGQCHSGHPAVFNSEVSMRPYIIVTCSLYVPDSEVTTVCQSLPLKAAAPSAGAARPTVPDCFTMHIGHGVYSFSHADCH